MNFRRLIGVVPATLVIGMICLAPAIASEKTKQLFIESPDRSDRTISEAEVQQIFDDMMVATERKDVDGIVKFLIPFAISKNTVRVWTAGKAKEIVAVLKGAEQQRRATQESFISIDSFDFLYHDVKIRVSPDRKTAFANVTSIVDARTVKGPRLLISSTSTTKFAIFRGEVKIISEESTSDVEVPPAFQPTVYNVHFN
jgi:hypothetical protein